MKALLAQIQFPPGTHLAMSNGTSPQNIEYCSKDNNDVLVYGETATTGGPSGKKSELAAAMIKDGASIKRVAEEMPDYFIHAYRGIKALKDALFSCDEPRDFKSFVKVYFGATGTGKSRKAHDEDSIQWTHGGDRWFDGYQGQEVVLFDDFAGVSSGITFRKLLQLTDRYPLTVPVKGGFTNWRPRTIIFTTNVYPDQWYPGEDYSPLKRRIDELIQFHSL